MSQPPSLWAATAALSEVARSGKAGLSELNAAPPPDPTPPNGSRRCLFSCLNATTIARCTLAGSASTASATSAATRDQRGSRRCDRRDGGHSSHASTSRSALFGRCLTAHLWATERLANGRVVIVNTRPLRPAKPAHVASPPDPPPRQNDRVAASLDGVAFARPCAVYREVGSERQRQWGAATDTPVSPGNRLLIVAKNGNTWRGTVDAIVGTAGNGCLVTLVDGKWQTVTEATGQQGFPAWSTE